ncbi:MAG TPA: response regulator [Gammaproteobacteria bacterium]
MSDSPEKVYRLLVIDDNRAIHEDFRKILIPNPALSALENMEADLFGENVEIKERQCFTIDSAFQGKDGLELVRQSMAQGRPYSLAFVDMRMPPGWDGIETIQHIWEEDPELQIVICSAYSDHSWSEISQRLGSSDRLLILKKPFDNVEITQMAHAMSRKCVLNRLEKRYRELGQTESAPETHMVKQQLDALSKFIGAIDSQFREPLQDVRKSVDLLNQSFNELSATLINLRNTLAAGSDLQPDQLLTEIQAVTAAGNLTHIQENIPGLFSRLQKTLEQINFNVDDLRGMVDNTTMH